jgi:hypothetical protein
VTCRPPTRVEIGYGGRYHSPDPRLQIQAGRRWIDEVLEIPVLSFAQFPFGRLKCYRQLTITGVSSGEMFSVLCAARASRISPDVIMTHPHDFVKGAKPGCPGVWANHINKRRLEALCERMSSCPFAFAMQVRVGSMPVHSKRQRSRHPSSPRLPHSCKTA